MAKAKPGEVRKIACVFNLKHKLDHCATGAPHSTLLADLAMLCKLWPQQGPEAHALVRWRQLIDCLVASQHCPGAALACMPVSYGRVSGGD